MASSSAAALALVTFGATVSGVETSLGLDHFFDKLLGVQLPCLVVSPDLESEQGFSTLAFLGKGGQDRFTLLHYLLVSPVTATADKSVIMPSLFTLKDAYFQALAALPFLSDPSAPAVHQSSRCTVRFQQINWNDAVYHGAIFRHDLLINL